MDETISYLKDRFKEEHDRFDHFENKCAKFLTAVSIVIAAVSALAGLKNGILFQVSSPLGLMIFLSFAAAAFCVTCSWGHALSALRISECPSLPSSRRTADYLLVVDAEQQKLHIYNCYIDTLEKLKTAIDEKSRPLELAYKELVWGAGFFMLLAILTTIRVLTE
ncbi:hypothetical protein C4J89_2785 [Pseudomonas sp. R4-35-07]|uniref:hypothetical protein n=1 Tax=Pseudomonas sp. R4-35-07 TaxID=658643 RepID=UPI000F56E6C8|nr:hypothetical protein [Pseudomonas sp. R4-35-07]AZF32260.1 hypothetical protein C4J89_2785 [Pseudomonas sp. R4-35-07]